jgi:hypothetical protein
MRYLFPSSGNKDKDYSALHCGRWLFISIRSRHYSLTFVFAPKETTVTVVLPEDIIKMLAAFATKKGDKEALACVELLGSIGHFDYTLKH